VQDLMRAQKDHTVLDVWESEPDIDLELLHHVAIATPHIAGYSLDAKIRGTDMIYQAVCCYFGLPVQVRINSVMSLPDQWPHLLTNHTKALTVQQPLNVRGCIAKAHV
jgi:hypothetical protein